MADTAPAPIPLSPWAQWTLILATLGFLALSLVDRVAHIDPTPPPNENRAPAPAPTWSWQPAALAAFPAAFERWDRDHFGLRATLIRTHARWELDVMGVSPHKKVLLGSDDWLYFAIPKSIDSYRCLSPFTDAGLAAEVRRVRAKRDWLAARGIAYLNVWAPIKPNVYPEHLPAWVRKTGATCRLDQWMRAMHAADLPVLDLRPAMANAKADGLAYSQTDSHWNPRGAWFAYRAILRALSEVKPPWRPLTEAEVQLRTEERPGGDLARMLGMRERFRSPTVVATLPSRCAPRPRPGWTPPRGVKVRTSHCPRGGPKVVMFHDSYGVALVPFMAETAGDLLSLEFSGFNKKVVERERPDVVIEVHVERQLQPDRSRPAP